MRSRRFTPRDLMLTALILNTGPDTGGQSIRWKQAADRVGGVRIRSVVRGNNYMRYPSDIRWQGNRGAVKRLYAAADVIHLMRRPLAYLLLDMGQRKPVLMHHRGTAFRTNPDAMLTLARRRNFEQAVSTIDLLRYAPDVLTWLPTAYNLRALAEIRAKHRRPDDGRIVISHAPTNRAIKSTDALIAAVEQLRDEGLPVELDVIEGVTHAECLQRKAASDLYFDQVGLGYGCNAVEAWGMGLPVIAGADEWTLNRMTAEFGGVLPFYPATEATIADAIRTLATSTDARGEYAEHGRNHVARFHAEEPAMERLIDLYQRAVARRGRKRATVTRAA